MTSASKNRILALAGGALVFVAAGAIFLRTIGYLPGAERVVVVRKVPLDDVKKWDNLFEERIKDPWIAPVELSANDMAGSNTIVIDGREVHTRRQDGSTRFSLSLMPSEDEGIYVADMDSDGVGDLVVFDAGDMVVRILYRNAGGKFRWKQSLGVRHHGGIVEDVKEDGQPDLVLKLDSGYEAWLLKRKTRR